MSQQNVETIRALYAAFAKGDVTTVLGALAPDAEWREADNFIYADGNPYVGPGAILQGVFMRLATEWDGFAAVFGQVIGSGETVVSIGHISGAYKATGKHFKAPTVHVWRFRDGKISGFQEYTDTVLVQRALS